MAEKWPQIAQKLPKIVHNGPKITQNGPKLAPAKKNSRDIYPVSPTFCISGEAPPSFHQQPILVEVLLQEKWMEM